MTRCPALSELRKQVKVGLELGASEKGKKRGQWCVVPRRSAKVANDVVYSLPTPTVRAFQGAFHYWLLAQRDPNMY